LGIKNQFFCAALSLDLVSPARYVICVFYLDSNRPGEGPNIIFQHILLQAVQSDSLFGSGIFSYIPRTSPFALAILVILLIFSLLSWTIIVRKWLTFRAIAHQSRAFVALFRKSSRLSEVGSASELYRKTPLSGLFHAGYQELNQQIQSLPQGTANPHPVLTERNITGIQRTLQRASAAELSVLERSMSWLATTGAVTPFIGLLGTVVGIISAFEGLGMEKTASIQAVAPGISEALVATAAGLFAAIPAVVAYNQFIAHIKNIASEMDDFSSEFLNIVERSFS
jgi:biopolymer transport protein TolQ